MQPNDAGNVIPEFKGSRVGRLSPPHRAAEPKNSAGAKGVRLKPASG